MSGFKTFGTGTLLPASDLNTYMVQQNFVRKTADESVTSSTTLQDDDHLVIAVEANTNYFIEAFLIYDGDAAGDFKFTFSVPAGATLALVGVVKDAVTGGVSGDIQSQSITGSGSTIDA